MAISIKNEEEIVRMRSVGQITAAVLDVLCAAVRPGLTTADLDGMAAEVIARHRARAACLNYCGFPGHLCISLNDEIVHGIPSPDRIIHDGDIVSLDLVVEKDGFMGDSTRTIPVGNVSARHRRLLDYTAEALARGIAMARSGKHVGVISHAIQTFAEARGLGVFRNLVGHGIGREMHEDPQVPNYGSPSDGPILRPGMTIAIEPMLSLGSFQTRTDDDGWTMRTLDGSWCAHCEHTVLITEGDPEILTKI